MAANGLQTVLFRRRNNNEWSKLLVGNAAVWSLPVCSNNLVEIVVVHGLHNSFVKVVADLNLRSRKFVLFNPRSASFFFDHGHHLL